MGARNFDPVLDALKNETEQQGEVEPCLRVIEPPERGRPQISIRRSLNSGDFEAVFVLEIASVQPPDSPLHRQSKSTIDFRRIMDIESTIRDRCPRSSKEFR